MIPVAANTLLDSGSYGATFRFVAEDEAGPLLELNPTQTPSVRADTKANIPRVLQNFTIPAHQRARIDPLSNRVRVTMRLADGTDWPCGLFVWAAGSADLASTNALFAGTLYDLGLLLDAPVPYTFGLAPGDGVTDAISFLVRDAGVDDSAIDPSDQRAAAPLNWPAGTIRRQILAELTDLASYVPVYFDVNGFARTHRPRPIELGAGHQYLPPTKRIIGGAIKETMISAPGAHLVIGGGVATGAVTGYAEVPFTNPLNPTRRRSTRVEVHRPQGITDSVHAQSMADGYAAQQPTDYRVVQIETVLDPRHDLYETVDFATPGQPAEAWRETGFAFACGAPWSMTHDLIKGSA